MDIYLEQLDELDNRLPHRSNLRTKYIAENALEGRSNEKKAFIKPLQKIYSLL